MKSSSSLRPWRRPPACRWGQGSSGSARAVASGRSPRDTAGEVSGTRRWRQVAPHPGFPALGPSLQERIRRVTPNWGSPAREFLFPAQPPHADRGHRSSRCPFPHGSTLPQHPTDDGRVPAPPPRHHSAPPAADPGLPTPHADQSAPLCRRPTAGLKHRVGAKLGLHV